MDPVPKPILPEKFLRYSWESNPGLLGWHNNNNNNNSNNSNNNNNNNNNVSQVAQATSSLATG